MEAARSSKGRDYGHGGCGRHSLADLELFLLMVISTGGRRPERRNLAANLPCYYGRTGTLDLISARPAERQARRYTLRQCAARFLDCAAAPLEMTNRSPFRAFPSERRHHISATPGTVGEESFFVWGKAPAGHIMVGREPHLGLSPRESAMRPSGGMADAGDLKSPARKGVWVQIPSGPVKNTGREPTRPYPASLIRIMIDSSAPGCHLDRRPKAPLCHLDRRSAQRTGAERSGCEPVVSGVCAKAHRPSKESFRPRSPS